MLTKTLISFTPTEFEIIEDRLGVPDTIAEALEIDIEIVESISVYDRTKKSVVVIVPKAAREALADALEGSTYLYKMNDAVSFGKITKSEYAYFKKAAKTAVAKLHSYGIKCEDVPY